MSTNSNKDDDEEEEELKIAIDMYKQQLEQIETLIKDEVDANSDLLTLKNDLVELLRLAQENLIELKKQKLLNELDRLDSYQNENQCSSKEILSESESNDNDLNDLIGYKCRVPFDCQITDIKFHNAIVSEIVSLDDNKFKVIFCNPTSNAMKMCKYFLDNSCKFDKNCKYSHGYELALENVQEFYEPNEESYKIGSNCLALDENDDLWHLATIESVDQEELVVQFKRINKTSVLPIEWVLPLESSDSNETELDIVSNFEPRKLSVINEYQSLGNLGSWEKHTKGIGSKLLTKMGYTPGKGLGSKGEGRVEPIDVYVLPAGKSLDKIMELKEKKILKKEKFKAKVELASSDKNVFEFINKTLLSGTSKKDLKTDPQITKSNDSQNLENLNIKIFKQQEQIKEVEKTIAKLKESLARNKNCDKSTLDGIRTKLKHNEQQLAKLNQIMNRMLKEKNNQKEKNDLF